MSPARIVALVLISVGTALTALLLGSTGWVFDEVEIVTEGWRQQSTRVEVLPPDSMLSIDRIRAKQAEDPDFPISDVVVVFFDEAATSDWPYYSPYPRSVLAGLVESLSAGGAAAIGIDVFLGDLKADEPENDQRLADAIQAAGNVILVAPTDFSGEDGPVLVQPDPLFADAAWAVASADLPTAFETVTDAALVTRSGDELEAGFALALWARRGEHDLDSLLTVWQAQGEVDLPGLPEESGRIPEGWFTGEAENIDAVLPLPVRFIGPPSDPGMKGIASTQTFQAVSSADLEFQLLLNPDAMRGKTVLLGSGFHDSDKFRTPFSSFTETVVSEDGSTEETDDTFQWMYGVEIHANVLQNYIDGEFLRRPGALGTFAWLFVLALFVAAGVFQAGPIVGFGAFAIGGLFVFAAGFFAWAGEVALGPGLSLLQFENAWLMLPMVPMAMATLLSYIASSSWVALVEGREKRFIQGAFGKYVSPDVVKTIAEDPDALQLGGQRRMLSIFFSDLSGFTTLSERLTPEALIAHLNEYLSEMTDIVMDEQGTLDKYIGDAIMAFWNAPAPVDDHADRALRCAILSQRKMNELNAKWLSEDPEADTLVVRIGINSGEVVVGNVGGENRFDYSAIGDSVNLAARLEPANKAYDTLNMCSEFTLAQLRRPDDFRVRELDFLAVKGKTKPVKVFEVVELAEATLPEAREQCLTRYEEGLQRYREHDWTGAADWFSAALEADPEDGPSRVYLERSRENEADPPPADWDFVVRRSVK